MTYTLSGEHGWIMDLGNAEDYWNIITTVQSSLKKGPLVDFINTGSTVDTFGVIKDIKKLLPSMEEPVKTLLQELADGLNKAGAFGVVTQ